MNKSNFDVSELTCLDKTEISKLSDQLSIDRGDGVTFILNLCDERAMIREILKWRIGKLISVWGYNNVVVQIGNDDAWEDDYHIYFPVLIETRQWFIPLEKIVKEKWTTNHSELAFRGVTIEDIKHAILTNFEAPFVISWWYDVDTTTVVDEIARKVWTTQPSTELWFSAG